MKLKHLIAMTLALPLAVSALAGCEVDVQNLGNKEETTNALNEEDLNNLLDGRDYAGLSADELGDLQNKLKDKGFIGADVTLPPISEPPPPPAAMPEGEKINTSEIYPLVMGVLNTFQSGNYTLKGRSTNFMGNSSMPLTMAQNKNSFMLETEMDWSAMMRDAAETASQAGLAAIQGATMQTLFGKKFRMVTTDKGFYLIFPDKGTYFDLFALMKETGDEAPDIGEMSGFSQEITKALGMREIPEDIPATKVKADGKEYLCATIMDETTKKPLQRFYFLGKEFKRLETFMDGESFVMEISSFKNTADESLFGVSKFRMMGLQELMKLGGASGFENLPR